MRALIYTRVSADNRQGRSVEEQEQECRVFCDRQGWEVVHIVKDNDRSASRYAKGNARPGWAEAKRRIADGDADVLVTWEASRTQRDLAAYVELRDLCRKHGVSWSYSGKTYNLDDVDDVFNTGLDALLGEREAGMTHKRVLRAIRANATAGRPHGRRAYGYQRVYDPNTGELLGQEPHPDEAPIVREIAERVLLGEPPFRIANDLNARCVPTPTGAAWHLSRIRRILTNPAYTALRVHQGKVLGEANWPAILDRDTFGRLQAVFDDPSRAKFRGGNDLKHLLSGIVRCGLCGARLYVGNDRGRPIYVCREGRQHLTRSQALLDAHVVKVVVEMLQRDDLDLSTPEDPRAQEAQLTARALRQRQEDAALAFARGEISVKVLATIESELQPQIDAADRYARKAALPTAIADIAGSDAASNWQQADIKVQRDAIAALVDVVVLPSRRPRGSRGFDSAAVQIVPRGDWRG